MSDCLLIDAGNTNLKWAVSHNGEMSVAQRMAYADKDLVQALSQRWPLAIPPKRVLLASVTTELRVRALKDWVQKSWNLPLEIISAQAQACGVVNGYAQPDQLGADRWAALIAARYLLSGAVCVVDCGTATTLDVINAEGRHLGGVIIPGLVLMRSSLLENTARIRDDASGAAEVLLARDTQSAVSGGSLQATAGFVERLQREVQKIIGVPMTTILCGGSAPDLLPLLPGDVRYQPDLVLKGLNIIAMSKA